MVLIEISGVFNNKMVVSGKMNVMALAKTIKGSSNNSIFFYVRQGEKKKLINSSQNLQELSQ